jgi:hypothetical protein
VRQGALGAPFEIVAGVFFDGEGNAAAAVAVTVDAFLDGVVHDFAGRDSGCCPVSEGGGLLRRGSVTGRTLGQHAGAGYAGRDNALEVWDIHGDSGYWNWIIGKQEEMQRMFNFEPC